MQERSEARKRDVLGNNSPESRKRSRPPPGAGPHVRSTSRSPPASPAHSDLDEDGGSDGSNLDDDCSSDEEEREMMEMLMMDSETEQPGGNQAADSAEGIPDSRGSDDTGDLLVFVSGRHKLELTPGHVVKLLKLGVREVVSKKSMMIRNQKLPKQIEESKAFSLPERFSGRNSK